jgi:hypothetical protein
MKRLNHRESESYERALWGTGVRCDREMRVQPGLLQTLLLRHPTQKVPIVWLVFWVRQRACLEAHRCDLGAPRVRARGRVAIAGRIVAFARARDGIGRRSIPWTGCQVLGAGDLFLLTDDRVPLHRDTNPDC